MHTYFSRNVLVVFIFLLGYEQIMSKIYLITGAGGWVGSRIVETLCKNNIDQVTELKLFDLKFSKDVKKTIEKLAAGMKQP